jgi:adenylosuccinate lyase
MSEAPHGGEIAAAITDIEPGPVSNVLSERYASREMKQIWSREGKIIAERLFWIAVMKGQAEAGLAIPEDHIRDYAEVVGQIDFASMKTREVKTQHDVKARIEEFNALAGHQDAHKGLTARDLTDNVEQLQIRLALELIRARMVAEVSRLAVASTLLVTQPVTGRSHNVPAQITSLGKRFSNIGEELIDAHADMTHHIETYKLRGLKGPVGTQQDMLDLFSGDKAKVAELEANIATTLGFSAVYNSVGQIYPRSRDHESLHRLTQSVAPLSNNAKNVRLMAGSELMTETTKNRDGSTAMPHKINPRTSERINSLYTVVRGFQGMVGEVSGDQWLVGSVADSVVRRVALESSFFATDGAYQAGLTVMDEFGVYGGVIETEINRNWPFLTSTKLLMAGIKAGMGREDAHKIIKKHSFDAIEAVRIHGAPSYDLYDRLARDPEFLLTMEEIIRDTTEKPINLAGMAPEQVEQFARDAEKVRDTNPAAAAYEPEPLL